MELLPKTDPAALMPIITISIQLYPDGKAILSGIPLNPQIMLDVIRMLTDQHMKAVQETQRRKSGLILPVSPIRNGA